MQLKKLTQPKSIAVVGVSDKHGFGKSAAVFDHFKRKLRHMPTSLVALRCYYYIIYARALQYIFNFITWFFSYLFKNPLSSANPPKNMHLIKK